MRGYIFIGAKACNTFCKISMQLSEDYCFYVRFRLPTKFLCNESDYETRSLRTL